MKKASFKKNILFAFYMLSSTTVAFSQNILPHIYLYPEYFIPAISTTVRIDPPVQDLGLGTTLNLENELGFNKTQGTFRFQAIAGSGSQIALSYMNINRKGSAYLTRDITFGDTVYNAGANANAYFNSQIFGVTCRFSIIHNPILTAGLSLGGRWMQAATGINIQSGEFIFSRDEKAGVPVPLIGVHGSVYILPWLLSRASLEYFHINVSGYDAKAADFRLSAEYYLLKNLGAGAAYSILQYNVNKFPFNNDFSGEVNYTLNGFSVFLAARF